MEGDVVAPPITGAGFDAPPIALCFGLAGPPSAFWASEGWETPVVNTPSDVTSNVTLNIALLFMDAPLRAIGGPAIPSPNMRSRRHLIQYPGLRKCEYCAGEGVTGQLRGKDHNIAKSAKYPGSGYLKYMTGRQ